MPEPRIRDVVGSGAGNPRARSFVAEAAGDSMACTICPHQEIFRNSNKPNTPRSLRYDLENALVGLCDVWFGEIKPYLVRNNIKLHVNCRSAGGDHQRPDAAGASPCFDPGAAPDNPPRTARYAGFSARPVARTPRRETTADRTPSRRPLSPLLSVPQTPLHDGTPVQSHNNEQKKVGQPHNRRRRRRRAQPSWRVPRLCRTFTVLCQPSTTASGAGSRAVKSTSHPPPQPQSLNDDYYRFIVPRRESVMKNKNTQTDEAPSVCRGCQSTRPRYHNPSPGHHSSRRPSPRRPSPPRAESGLTHTASNNGSATPPPILPLRIICRPKQPQALAAEMPSLLQDDLIDIIAESNEKRIKLLYSNSEKNDRDHPSFMNLIVSSRQEKPDHKKLPPWR